MRNLLAAFAADFGDQTRDAAADRIGTGLLFWFFLRLVIGKQAPRIAAGPFGVDAHFDSFARRVPRWFMTTSFQY